MRHRCLGFDRIIDTDRAIPGTFRIPADSDETPAIRIRWRPAITAPAEERPVWCRTQDALWFDPPGIARYRCTAHEVEVTPIAGASRERIDALLIATALPALLWLQGDVVLHAAAVVPAGGDGALAIAGASGSGKSRLAAALLADGARFVADDSIAVRLCDGRTICTGLAAGYHLGAPGSATRAFHPVAERRACRSARLAAVIVLCDDVASLVRLSGADAIEVLLANRHRASVARLAKAELDSFFDLIRVAQTVPVYRLPRNGADALLDDDVRRAILSGRAIDDRTNVATDR